MKKTKLEKGITLIALIITIVVLLILAVVTIGAIQESKIIAHAKNAATSYNDEKAKEESAIAGYEALIDSKLPGENGGGSIDPNASVPATTIVEAQLDSMLTKTVNSNITDKYNNKITVPAGFKILVDSTTGYNSENLDVTKGIVIQDAEGNEFVWIPVGENITNGTKTATIKLSRYSFASDGTPTESESGEVVKSEYGVATAKNLTGFLNSANTNKGYYIARFEAGVTGFDANNITTRNNDAEINWTGYVEAEGKELKLVSKSGQQVWNYVTQNKASELCQSMYATNSNFASDLINSYSWDTAIVFIQTFGTEYDANKYSRLNKSTSFANTGINGDKYCNIHDMSGNANEWSTESNEEDHLPCIPRGGFWDNSEESRFGYTCISGIYDPSNYWRGTSLTRASSIGTFRPILYIEL